MLSASQSVRRQVKSMALLRAILPVLVGAVVAGPQAEALPRTWIGGSSDWNTSTANWSPADEPDSDDEAIFNTSHTVNLANASESIMALTMSGGIDLFTNDNDITIDGLLQLSGASTNLNIGGSTSSVTADSVTINSGAGVILNGGLLTVVEELGAGLFDINVGGTLAGNGVVNLTDGVTVVTALLINDGTLSASSPAAIIGGPPARTLQINANDADARIDLDGAAENGVVNVFRNQTLDLNLPLLDIFNGDINLFQNSTLDLRSNWTLGAGGTIDVDNGFVDSPIPFPDVPAGVAFISGSSFAQNDGTITVVDNDGTLQFNAPFTMNGGSLVNNGLVVFGATTTIGSGANFTMPTNSSSITVNDNVTVNVDQANFNADGSGTTTNVITIGLNAVLDLDLGAGADETLTGVIHLNGGELDVTTADNTWAIDGDLTVGAGTGISQINGEELTLNGTTITVGGGNSTLDVNAVNVWNSAAHLVVNATSTARFDNNITFNQTNTSFTGAGTMILGSTSTVAQNTTIATGMFDWDGTGLGTHHTINEGVTFTINSPVLDSDGDMDDPIDMAGNGSTLIVNGPAQWTMNGTLTTGLSTATGVSTIGGTSRMVLGSTGVLSVADNAKVDAPITFGAGSTANVNATRQLTVNGDAIYAGGTIGGFRYDPPAGSRNTVTASSTIIVTNFNFDRGDWVIDPGTTLTVNVADYDADVAVDDFASILTINSGTISMTANNSSSFVLNNGTLNLNNTMGTLPTWSGEPLDIGNDSGTLDANINVGGSGNSRIQSPVTFKSDADVHIDTGAALFLNNTAAFDTVNGANNAEFTGTGGLLFNAQVNVNEAVTLNMVGGTVDLDGTDSFGDVVSVNAPLVINAATLASFGRVNSVGTNILDINNSTGTGSITVNLDDPTAEWTLNAPGVINLANDNDTFVATLLFGAPINVNGTVNVSGAVRTAARLNIGSTATVNIAAGGQLHLVHPNINTIAGGTINGPGPLVAADGELVGFGTINTDIRFATSDLRADDGVLTVNGMIAVVHTIGPRDSDGVLNVTTPWDTSSATMVRLFGGEIRGATITNSGELGIGGSGLISARVINNTSISASDESLLTLETAANNNDWDGTTNNGRLIAFRGDMIIRDNAPFRFSGTVSVDRDRTFFAEGFELEFEPGSTLRLIGGTYRKAANVDTHFGGTISVNAGSESTLTSDAGSGIFIFEATSDTNLADVLRLDSDSTIHDGATFSGDGTLRNLANKALSTGNGNIINVVLENHGTFAPAGSASGRVNVKSYRQSSTGRFEGQIEGASLNQFDRLVVNGIAQLDGVLDVELAMGFVPSLGQSFNIINAADGVSGAFSSVEQPAPIGLLNLVLRPTYQPTLVSLALTRAFYEVQSGPHPENFTGTGFELVKTTSNTATLSGNNTYTGLTTVMDGTLIFANPGSVASGGLSVRAGAIAQLSAGFSEAALLTSLSIAGSTNAWTGRLDIADNKLIIAAAAPDTVSAIRNQLSAGRNVPPGGAANGRWDGASGIVSSAAANANAAAGSEVRSVGYLLNGDSLFTFTQFGGRPVNPGDLLVRFTRNADANLDGLVNNTDITILAGFYRPGTSGRHWYQGDFNFDGEVNNNDITILAGFYAPNATPLGASGLMGAITAVPEPSLGPLILAFAGLLFRRRHIQI